MISSIRMQNTVTPYSNEVNKNNYESLSGTSFSKVFSQAKESLEKTNQVTSADKSGLTRADMVSVIQDKIRELQDKLENGETEPTYQIGAKAFTKKEWDNLIYKVDNALEKDENEDENESEENNVNAINPKDKEK